MLKHNITLRNQSKNRMTNSIVDPNQIECCRIHYME